MSDFLLMVSGALFAMLVSGIVNYGKREWVGLTEKERLDLAVDLGAMSADWIPFMEAVEAKLKEKNT